MISEPTQQPLKIRDLLNVFTRQRISIIVILFLSMISGYLVTRFTKPIWHSSTQMLVEAGGSTAGRNRESDPLSMMQAPYEAVDIPTQIQVLQSAKILLEAFESAGVGAPAAGATSDNLPLVKVDQVGTTNVLAVSVESPSAELVQSLTVVIPQVYLRYVKDTRQGNLEALLRFLSGRLIEEKEALAAAEKDYNVWKNSRTLTQLAGEQGVRGGRVVTAQNEEVKLKALIAELETRLQAMRATLNSLPKTIRNPVRSTNPQLLAQRNSIAQLKARRETMLSTFYPDYPEIKNLDAEIKSQENLLKTIPEFVSTQSFIDNPEIRAYQARIMQTQIDLSATRENLRQIQAQTEKSQLEYKAYSNLQPREAELQSKIDLKKNTIANITRDYDELRVRRNSVKDPVTVLTPPTPLELVRPKKAQTMAVAFLLGLVLAVSFALLKDGLDDRLASAEEVYTVTGLPALGQMPALPKRGAALAKASIEGDALESYQMLRFNLLFSTLENPVKSIVVTSTNSGEGKTELACNLAVAASGEGRRVILVDANLRSPSIHKKMNVDGKPGLTDVVLGLAELEASLHPTAIPGLMVLTCGSPMLMPADLLASEGMKDVFARMQELADLVIFDAPSVSGTADAQILSNLAESVVYVGKVGATRRAEMRRGLDSLRQARARILGVALSGGKDSGKPSRRRTA